MSDEAREYIRAAQAAEISGDRARAVELLRKAAVVYRDRGNNTRALHMLQHARRLGVNAPEVDADIKRLEWLPENPLARAAVAVSADVEAEAERALESLDAVAGPPPKQLVERGPTRADPTLQAWCSFCCRPRAEIGDLVAGPAGAFICRECLRESAKLLGAEAPVEQGTRAASPVELDPPADAPPELVGQAEAVHLLDGGLRRGARVLLLLGPEGTGKTTYLRALADQGAGRYVDDVADLLNVAPGERLLLDLDLESLGSEAVRDLVDTAPLLIALRSEPVTSGVTLVSEHLELPLVSGVDLVAATGGALPLWLADRVQVFASFRALTTDELEEIARRLLGARASELDVGEELVTALAGMASKSGRGGHELAAFVRRLPPGSWSLKASPSHAVVPATSPGSGGGKASRRRSKKKGEDG